MTELMEQMAELLEAARRQGIAEAAAAVENLWKTSGSEDQADGYADGLDDALITIRALT